MASQFDHITFTWIPREKNKHADRLANEAMDAAAEVAAEAGEQQPEPPAKVDSSPGWTGATGSPTRLLLLRHGQTELSVQRRYSGRGNPALTELGRRQADAAAQLPRQRGGIAAVVCSPLQRAYDTAAAAAKALGLDVVVDDDLIETDFGDWEGLTFAEAADRGSRTAPALAARHRASLRPAGRASTRCTTGCGGRAAGSSPSTGLDRAGGFARDADQDAAADGARRRAGDALPAAPGPGVAVDCGVLSRRRGIGAAGEPDGVSVSDAR